MAWREDGFRTICEPEPSEQRVVILHERQNDACTQKAIATYVSQAGADVYAQRRNCLTRMLETHANGDIHSISTLPMLPVNMNKRRQNSG